MRTHTKVDMLYSCICYLLQMERKWFNYIRYINLVTTMNIHCIYKNSHWSRKDSMMIE